MEIRESGQDYLEAILILSQEKSDVRAADLCGYFGYSRPTVSIMLKHLKEAGFVIVDEKNHIKLTASGLTEAEAVYDRHKFLTNFFIDIGVSADVATRDACRLEHYVSSETFEALKNHFYNK